MSPAPTIQNRSRKVDLFVLVSHLSIGLLAAFSERFLHYVPWLWVRLLILSVLVLAAWLLFLRFRKAQHEAEEADGTAWQAQLDAMDQERQQWRRLCELNSHIMKIIDQFLKSRYRLNHSLATRLSDDLRAGNINVKTFKKALSEFDSERRAQVKDALGQISNDLRKDTFLRPGEASKAVKDFFKVSFYSVGPDPAGHDPCLVKKWRFFPNESEPKTEKFHYGEGAAGQAWEKKRIVVCERGGQDGRFKEMWGGQQSDYASMICVPAIADLPAHKVNDVHGVLTVHTSVRQGYFEETLEQFWADLFDPLCNALVYLDKSEYLIRTLVETVEALVIPQASSKTAPD
jgi:hypothetical protein